MKSLSTRNWIIGLLIGSWIATFVVGSLHGAELLTEPANPIMHTFQDWIILIVFLLPISYGFARIIPSK